jgi:hypothetical protein
MGPFKICEENKVLWMGPLKPYSEQLMNGPKKLDCYITLGAVFTTPNFIHNL